MVVIQEIRSAVTRESCASPVSANWNYVWDMDRLLDKSALSLDKVKQEVDGEPDDVWLSWRDSASFSAEAQDERR